MHPPGACSGGVATGMRRKCWKCPWAAWWNGRHSRLKICFWETGVPVRVRARPPLAKMARHPLPRRDFTQQRGLAAAALLRVGAASVEGAAGRRVHRTRYVAGKRALRPLELGIWNRHRREQGFGIGMQRIEEERLFLRILDDLAEIHHGDAVADMLDNCRPMRDDQVGEPLLPMQVIQRLEPLRLIALFRR